MGSRAGFCDEFFSATTIWRGNQGKPKRRKFNREIPGRGKGKLGKQGMVQGGRQESAGTRRLWRDKGREWHFKRWLRFGSVTGLCKPAPSPKPRQNPKIPAPKGHLVF
jgi:hypothetical protein